MHRTEATHQRFKVINLFLQQQVGGWGVQNNDNAAETSGEICFETACYSGTLHQVAIPFLSNRLTPK